MRYSILLAAAFQLAQAHEHGHAHLHHRQNEHKRGLETYVDVTYVTVTVTVTAGEEPSTQTQASSSSTTSSISASSISSSSLPAVSTLSSATLSAPPAYLSTSSSGYVASSASTPAYSGSASASYSSSSPASYAASSAPQVSSSASSSTFTSTYVASTSSTSAAAALATASTSGKSSSSSESYSGEATFYGGNVAGGTCSFSTYTLPSGLYGTALSSSNWNNSANCGGCVSVSYGGKSITAMIVDQCPGCGDNHLDLFPTAFSALADESLGVIDVTWEYTDCTAVTGPLEIHLKSGVSEYWFSAQVVNGNDRTASMEVSTDGGSTWTSTDRQTYNFFEISSGVGASTATVRVTSFSGNVVTVDNVSMTSDAVVTASANY